MTTLGLDVGASKIYYVVLEREKRLTEGEFRLTSKTSRAFLKLCQEINQRLQKQGTTIEKVGIGLPGIVEGEKLSYAPNFPKLTKLNLVQELEKVFGVKVVMTNDANAFTFAEATKGAAKDLRSVLGLTLGTGLGGGLVIDGKPYVGKGGAEEIGHMILGLRGEKEAEDIASAKFFKKFGQTPDDLRQKAESGDAGAKEAFREFGKNLGIVVANLVNLIDPEAIVLGGGVANAYGLFISEVKKTAAQRIVNPKSKDVKILKTALGPAAGAIGAALLAR